MHGQCKEQNMANKSRNILTSEVRFSYVNVLEPTQYKDPKTGALGKWSYHLELIIEEANLTKFQMKNETGALVDADISKVLRELALEAWPELAQQAMGPDGRPMFGANGQPISGLLVAFSGTGEKGWPLRRGDKFADLAKTKGKDGEHYRGKRIMTAKSNVHPKTNPPSLSMSIDGKTRVLNRLVPSDMAAAKLAFTGGNYGYAELNIVTQDVAGGKFLTVYLNSLRYSRDGAKFGNQGGDLMSKFDGIQGGTAAYDPTKGMAMADEIPF